MSLKVAIKDFGNSRLINKFHSYPSKGEGIKNLLIIFRVVFIFSFLILLFLTPLYLFISPLWLHYEYRKPFDLPVGWYNFSMSKRLKLAEETLYFIRSEKEIDFLDELKIEGIPVYSKREKVHLVEVRNLIQKFLDVHLIAFIVCLISFSILILSKKIILKLPSYLLKSCVVFLALTSILSITIILNWEKLFRQFHQMFFKHGNYNFSYLSTIIQLFPPAFWLDTSLAWILFVLTEVLLIMGLLFLIKIRYKKIRNF